MLIGYAQWFREQLMQGAWYLKATDEWRIKDETIKNHQILESKDKKKSNSMEN